MDSLEEEKESELVEAQEELRVAREEVLLLQQAAEEAAAERENDIASLQEELCRRRAELQRLSEETQEYELEITTLRAEISMKSQRREAERREGEPQEERASVCPRKPPVQTQKMEAELEGNDIIQKTNPDITHWIQDVCVCVCGFSQDVQCPPLAYMTSPVLAADKNKAGRLFCMLRSRNVSVLQPTGEINCRL